VLPNAGGLSKELIGEYMLGLCDDFARHAAERTEEPA
jgi:hypothetical protein